MNETDLFLRCARAYVELVRAVGPADWTRPGLGEWDVRALVGHTTRALTTVVEYLAGAAPDSADVITAPEYFARFVASDDKAAADEAVAVRGHLAGTELGVDPALAVSSLVSEAERALAGARPQQLVATRFGTLRLEEYLRTRTFELVVHGLDLVRAVGAPADLVPRDGVAAALGLAAQTAAASGRGPAVLAALTGRTPLPDGFSLL
ncbi:maleylpyruvate isomerase N-terminal domain-containing protein [Georgenia satyanarayanai]|uniref:maleylpyruvate isomerase N-terminal domain-containing protein n=1 Tax=Georgenia satyanarayanai TaxID=860221 RepID=UPI001265962F|nr:maleylpyruvate isomerase N-terminal domain-containing protein [Georgenia satyanarayanai]